MRSKRHPFGNRDFGGLQRNRPAGVELERQILERARQSQMRIIGPNCLGVMSPHTGLMPLSRAAWRCLGTSRF
jgi:hypothetical protein